MTLGGNRPRGVRGSRRGADPRGPQRDRRGENIRFGPEFELINGEWRLKTTGALAVNQRGELCVEVTPPLAQSSPLRVAVDEETVEVRNGVLRAKPLAIGGGLSRDSDGVVSSREESAEYRSSSSVNLNDSDVDVVWTDTDHQDPSFSLSTNGVEVRVLTSGVYVATAVLVLALPGIVLPRVAFQFSTGGAKVGPPVFSPTLATATDVTVSISKRLRLRAGTSLKLVSAIDSVAGTVALSGSSSSLTVERRGAL